MTVNAHTPPRTRPHVERKNHGKGHSYLLDGKAVPGVTTALSKGLPKAGLPNWAARTVATYVADAPPEVLEGLRTLGRDPMIEALKRIPWAQRDEAAVRGTTVHGLAEQLIKGERVDVPEPLAGYVESAVAFMDAWRPAPVLVEAVVASRQFRYAGTIDLIADLPDGRRTLMDYKTAKSGVFPDVALQLAAYRHADIFLDPAGAECQMAALDVDCSYAVWLRADGFDVYPVETSAEVFRAFLHVLHVARAVDRMPEWLGESEHWAVTS